METNSFQYKDAIQIGYRCCKFDSLLELKFVLSIEHNLYFSRKYTPDFLIRNKGNNKAFLIELKPAEFRNEMQLKIRKQAAENYIKSRNADWVFRVVYDDEIILSLQQQEKLASLRERINAFNLKCHFDNLDKKWNINKRNYFKTIPGGREVINPTVYARFVKYGLGAING